ncbi:hypothetical protein [Nannocystis punicea]|uniref:DUF4345 domain-containing protein n=1 Tax=Nannocystis punicea TaxID=2995304 RepID=A0ABY7H127_9BACT|nr:hypothetical protein [Nannocystis poenicansa]WAS92952.1 hypothetical protein O0S08_42835 [Nannocystis poenicansa]
MSGWSVAVFGVLALLLGLLGLLSPDSQFDMMGFELVDQRAPGDYTPGVVATTSIAAINMGILYVLGVALAWPGFVAFTVGARLFMCVGFVALMAAGRAPDVFVGAAIWEGVGAAITAVAMAWDGRSTR